MIDAKVSKSGDTMTGNLTVGSAKMQTNGYVVGTWFQSNANIALGEKGTKFVVHHNNWFYTRTAEQTRGDIGAAAVADYTATVSTSWSGTAALFTQNVAISGIAATDKPIIDLVPSTTAWETQEAEWGKIVKAESYNGGIKFYAREKTTTALSISVKVVK